MALPWPGAGKVAEVDPLCGLSRHGIDHATVGIAVVGKAKQRADVIGNVAVMLAALGVFGTNTLWPDVVAAIMAVCRLAAAGRSCDRRAVRYAPAGRRRFHAE